MNLFTGEDLAAVALSLKVAFAAMILGGPLAFGVAYLLARRRFPGRSVLEAAVFLPLVLPPVATGYALLMLLGRKGPVGAILAKLGIVLAFHWTGAAVAGAVMAFPLMVRPMRLAIEAIDPEALEAARTLGAPAATRLVRVVMPLASRGILAGLVLGFAKALGEFGATITFVAAIPGETLTLPSDIWQATQSSGSETRAAVLCAVAAALAFAAVLASERVAAALRGSAADPSSRAGGAAR